MKYFLTFVLLLVTNFLFGKSFSSDFGGCFNRDEEGFATCEQTLSEQCDPDRFYPEKACPNFGACEFTVRGATLCSLMTKSDCRDVNRSEWTAGKLCE